MPHRLPALLLVALLLLQGFSAAWALAPAGLGKAAGADMPCHHAAAAAVEKAAACCDSDADAACVLHCQGLGAALQLPLPAFEAAALPALLPLPRVATPHTTPPETPFRPPAVATG